MDVIVYTTPACPYCVLVKNFLKQNNVKFREIDVSKNKTLADELVKKSGVMSVPVTEIDGKIVVGYNIEKLRELLKL